MRSKETVVMLHASTSSGAQWRSLAGALAQRYLVHTPNFGSAGPRPFSLAAEAAPIRELIERAGTPVHLVGHSYGGAVALHLARTSPQLVRKLVLVEPVAFHLLREGDAIDRQGLHEFTSTADSVRGAFEPEAAARIFIDYWNGAGSWDRLPADKRAPVIAALPRLHREIEAVLSEPAGLRDMRSVRQPVLLVQGGLTRLSTRCVSHCLAMTLPVVSYQVVRGAGHMLPLTHRDQVNRLVVAHLAEPYAGGHWGNLPQGRLKEVSAPGGRRSGPRSAGGWRRGA